MGTLFKLFSEGTTTIEVIWHDTTRGHLFTTTASHLILRRKDIENQNNNTSGNFTQLLLLLLLVAYYVQLQLFNDHHSKENAFQKWLVFITADSTIDYAVLLSLVCLLVKWKQQQAIYCIHSGHKHIKPVIINSSEWISKKECFKKMSRTNVECGYQNGMLHCILSWILCGNSSNKQQFIRQVDEYCWQKR